MYLTLAFRLDHEYDETAAYEEQVEGDRSPVIGSISLSKSALPTPPPAVVRITLTYEEGRLAPTGPSALSFRPGTSARQPALHAGDRVVVVKNRLATLASPPEWLEQYLGKTGTILWTTGSGAMLDISGSATWFAFEELEQADPEAAP